MAIKYQEETKTYIVHIKGRKYVYTISRYGPLAKLLAEQSFKYNKKFKNYITTENDCCIMKIYNKVTNLIYDVKIDESFIDKIQEVKWYINFPQNAKTLYVASDKFGKLHRYLLNIKDPKIQIDHINHDGLDNRLSNLRKVNQSINSKNCTVKSNSKTGINGVHFKKKNKKTPARWVAVWTDKNGKACKKTFSINKYFNAYELAIKARKQAEIENDYLI